MKNKSFTLIELLVVIVIIGILAGVIIVSTSSSISKANIAKVKVFENSVLNELGANMVSRWKLDEIVGTTTTPDAWGNNTGTLGDGVTASTYPTSKSESECVTGKCMYFDGGDYINCGNDSSLNITKNITISLWVNLLGNGYGITPGIISRRNDGFGLIWTNNGETEISSRLYQLDGTAINLNVFAITKEVWHNIVLVANSSNNIVKIYMDSIQQGSPSSYDGTIRTGSSLLYIGCQSTHYFNGYIDDVRIYNGAISSAQIKQNYIAGLNSLLANNNISKEEYLSRIENLSLND